MRVGLPRKKPRVFKPTFTIPEELLSLGGAAGEAAKVWDEKGSYLQNYRTFGVVANPNLLGVRARTPAIIQSLDLQLPNLDPPPVSEFDPVDTGSDLESDGLKAALGKKLRDGKAAPPKPLTTVQRVHVGRLINKYGDDYQAMFMDTKLNSMQHSVATLKKLCKRYHVHRKDYITT